MILQFIIAAALLLVLFSAMMIIPFIRSKAPEIKDRERRNQLNHELYDVRLKEVNDDIAQGVVVDEEAIIIELQHNLLDDISEEKQVKLNNSQWIWVPGVIAFICLSIALYSSVGSFKEVSDWEGALQRYPEIRKQLFEQPDKRPNEAELKELMLGLRTHLVNEPNDAQGWVLYSRLGRVFKDKELASGAIEKAFKAAPNNIEIELEYIELKTKLGDENSRAVAELMLAKFLQRHPDSYDAWSMYGFIALQREDFKAAIARWKQMLTLVGNNSQKAAMLNQSIAYAENELFLKNNPKKSIAQPIKLKADVVGSVVTKEAIKTPVIEGTAYQVNISLAAQVSYTKNSTLFVYAQSVNGPPMPIAAIKLPINDFPVKVVLSDANAMIKGVKLSDQKQFIIKARISTDGTVNKKSGQWFGKSSVIKSGAVDLIEIEINQKS